MKKIIYVVSLHVVFLLSLYANWLQYIAKREKEVIVQYKREVVNRDVVKYIKGNKQLPPEVRDRIVEIVGECEKQIPPVKRKSLGFQGAYANGKGYVGLDWPVLTYKRVSLNLGAIQIGPTATISYRLNMKYINNLQLMAGAVGNINSKELNPIIGFRLPL